MQLAASLQQYRMRPPSDPDKSVSAVRASLRLLSVAPDRISLPLLAAVYRAPFGGTDFSLFLTGRTGSFKTALGALCQQHFGSAMDAGHLPANFASTANALEEFAFGAKDALLVVDDFAPTGGLADSALHAVAEGLFRASGNHQGRSRLGGHGDLRAPRPPRALILATGEEVPKGHSLRARLLIVELKPGEVNRTVLSECQQAGREGVFATAMSAYLRWIAGRYQELQERLRTGVHDLRTVQNGSSSVHARLPGTVAELQCGWETWLHFAVEIGAVSRAEAKRLQHRANVALTEVADMQAIYHQESDPALRFLALLQAAISAGRAHVTDREGHIPISPEQWGWRRKANGRRWIPQGKRIGWLAATELFLEPAASYESAQQIAGAERLPISSQTLRHRLREHGLLASVDTGRQMLMVRRTLEGIPRQVLHVRARDVVAPASEMDNIGGR